MKKLVLGKRWVMVSYPRETLRLEDKLSVHEMDHYRGRSLHVYTCLYFLLSDSILLTSSDGGSVFKLHDFGFRGVSSVESAAIGGVA